jgi:hypothetical protein
MSPTSFRFVLFLTSAFLWHSTGFAQPFREISKQTFVVKSDTIVRGDTTAVIQTLGRVDNYFTVTESETMPEK